MQTESRTASLAGWGVVAALFAATTCVESMSWTQLTAYAPLYLRELHVPATQVPGWIAAMSSLGWILALPMARSGASSPIGTAASSSSCAAPPSRP